MESFMRMGDQRRKRRRALAYLEGFAIWRDGKEEGGVHRHTVWSMDKHNRTKIIFAATVTKQS